MELLSKRLIEEATLHADSISLDSNTSAIRVALDRRSMLDSSTAVACQLFISLDDGKSWRPWGGFGCVGGEILTDDSKVSEESYMIVKIPSSKETRKLKATITSVGRTETSLKIDEIRDV